MTRTFVVTLRSVAGVNGDAAMKLVLKDARRRGMRCIGIVEEATGEAPVLKDPDEDGIADRVVEAVRHSNDVGTGG